ncbi:septal ring lytic transglycosylase RlpA family protein [Congregibacter variabilis]|uniref:Endolytic peptidoglycan transglycosylase RlpA n=1 Tax=Congregibacter variabilis TaxID=3081200 RepID=A0ABZ0HZ11_9GAMM|nr:septal ring lytic transglycosylase RlpA family protein [Congregibacter sp. IMCC43200]
MNRSGLALLLVFSVSTLLVACSSSEPKVAWEGDGAPVADLNPDDVADATPRPDPILRAGNTSPYSIDGVEYQVLPTAEGYSAKGIASWYGTKFHGNKTANGEVYDLYLATAAHRSLPIPSYARVTNLWNGREIVVRVNDRGPFHPDRLIDLSYAAAVKLGFVDKGTAEVLVETITLAGVDDLRDSETGAYRYLQLGAFASPETANSLRDAVAALVTVPVNVTPVDVGGQRLNRVRVGPVADGDQLRYLRDLLMTRGYSPGLALP